MQVLGSLQLHLLTFNHAGTMQLCDVLGQCMLQRSCLSINRWWCF